MALAEADFKRAMGAVLSGYRGELRYSQREMGMLLGVGQRTISEIENGTRMLTAVEIIMFPKALAGVLPYSEVEIRDKLINSPHLGLTASDSPIPGSLISVAA